MTAHNNHLYLYLYVFCPPDHATANFVLRKRFYLQDIIEQPSHVRTGPTQFVFVRKLCVYICMCVCMHIFLHSCVCVCVCVHACAHMCIMLSVSL